MKLRSSALIWLLLLPLLTGCPKVPVTGRRSLVLVPESQEVALGLQAYREILSQSKISTDAEATAMVRRAGERIAKISDRPDYEWEYTLIDDPKTENAFCLPGGKVAVYTGLLPITQNEAGLAVVMGHEIAHAIAKHGAERLSEQMLLTVGEVSLAVAMQKKPQETRVLMQTAYGVGTGLAVVLPFGRFQEAEADHIGLIYAAKAGYDPREALSFWARMDEMSKGRQPPEFLSTHPSHETRLKNLKSWMPEALREYDSSPH
ncbi:MAG: M48 family metallopeptidase [Elusimicrobia bacterium]|nr:M48 family metallopeptidase [Elusimicrobiota bacterium]